MNIRPMLHSAMAGASGALALTLLLAPTGAAQTVNSSGNANITDVSGTIITTGDLVSGMFAGNPGPVQTFFCAAATGVRNEALAMTRELERGEFWIARRNPGTVLLPDPTRATLLAVVAGGEGRRAGAGELAEALAPAGNDARSTRRAARDLSRAMEGLLATVSDMDPERPGYRGPTHLTRAVAHFNTYVNQSSAEYLQNPSDEFLAVQAILSRLVIAALEYESRPDGCGWAPPPPPVPTTPPPPPVVERLTAVCLMVDDELREVPTIVIPATGDSLVVVEGERKPLSEVYPPRRYAPGAELAESDASVELEGRTYLKFGLPRAARPGEMVRRGEFDGVGLFFEPRAPMPPEILYVPVGPACVVQPYQRQEVVRQVDG